MEISLTDFRLLVIRQGGLFIAYSRKLDLATTGKSEKQAMGNFADLAKIFTKQMIEEETERPGASSQMLIDLGWTNRAKRWTPPLKLGEKKQ